MRKKAKQVITKGCEKQIGSDQRFLPTKSCFDSE